MRCTVADAVVASAGNSHSVAPMAWTASPSTPSPHSTAESTLLLNETIHATIGTVDTVGTGTGYAAFR